ncbi:MAG: biotin/lipoate A/B protein ligase family protein [Isosphaeraceae bacterium]
MQCFDLTCSRVEEDLALDEALLIEADGSNGPAVLRFWEPRHNAVVLGASRTIRDDVLVEACRVDGVPVLRRSSGGGTVVVGPGVLNVAFVLPETRAPGLWAVDAAHRYVLERLAESMARAGQPVTIEGSGDLVKGGRKCGGSAQRRLKHWFMVHCSILYQMPVERIARYLALPDRQPAYRERRSHQDFMSNLPLPRRTLVEAIRATWSPGSVPCPPPPRALALVPDLVSEKFGNRGWIERF